MSGRCTWENYQGYLQRMHVVRDALVAQGVGDVALIDAHSFCWMISQDARLVAAREEPAEQVPLPVLFTGSFVERRRPTFDRTAAEDSKPVEYGPESDARRRAAGRQAEPVALEAEKERLRNQGHPDLADRVALVSERPGFGHDITSFEEPNVERQIEVKNVSNGRRFFLTENEWRTSRRLPNYWFYLVSIFDDGTNRTEMARASDLLEEHLMPAQYIVSFTAGPPSQ